MQNDPFGLSTDPASKARARDKLAKVLVWEIRYTPDANAERLRQPRTVTVSVVGENSDGLIDAAHPCNVTWTVIGVPKNDAIPYGCEWRLDRYASSCQP